MASRDVLDQVAADRLRSQFARFLAAAIVAVSLLGFPLGASADGPEPSIGQVAGINALAVMGSPYVLGTPPRPGAAADNPPSFDCSGLIWWIATKKLGLSGFPTVAATQAEVGVILDGAPWTTALPVGALLFLSDANQGPGITHVSMYLGDGVAADCYNEGSGCLLHDVTKDSYYFNHWTYATYPWGDTPVVASLGAIDVVTGSGVQVGTSASQNGGALSVSVYQQITQPGAIRAAVATPVMQAGQTVNGAVGVMATAIASRDPQAMATEQLSGAASVFGYVKTLDSLFPLRLMLLFTMVLVVLMVRFGLSVIRYVIDLLPG